jgi:DNA-binding IclR family transcriptional regulator
VSNNRTSDVGVLDKAAALLDALARPGGPFSLPQLSAATGLHRATAHRLLKALQVHGLARMDEQAKWFLGARLMHLGRMATEGLPLANLSIPALTALRDETGESVQLYVREGSDRVCIAALESPHGLRTIVAVGTVFALPLGSAGHVLAEQSLRTAEPADSSTERTWRESVEEREAGVASVSAAVRDADGNVRAAVSVSGPLERTTRQPGSRYGNAVIGAAIAIEAAAGWRR